MSLIPDAAREEPLTVSEMLELATLLERGETRWDAGRGKWVAAAHRPTAREWIGIIDALRIAAGRAP